MCNCHSDCEQAAQWAFNRARAATAAATTAAATAAAAPMERDETAFRVAVLTHGTSEVAPNLFVGPIEMARDEDTLQRGGVTLIVNCVGAHGGQVSLSDSAGIKLIHMAVNWKQRRNERAVQVYHEVMERLQEDERVLIFCKRGRSRSAAVAVAMIAMSSWSGHEHGSRRVAGDDALDVLYDQSYEQVSAARPEILIDSGTKAVCKDILAHYMQQLTL